jgi:hypothetical protein
MDSRPQLAIQQAPLNDPTLTNGGADSIAPSYHDYAIYSPLNIDFSTPEIANRTHDI